MTRIKLMRIAMATLVVMIVIGVALTVTLLIPSEDKNIISVSIDSGETKHVEFEELCLVPAEKSEYIIKLESDTDDFEVELDFRELEHSELKQYAYVRIEAAGRLVCDELLGNVLESDGEPLSFVLSKDDQKEILVTYYIPEQVGNEAQNVEADFELLITVSNE